MSDLMEIQSSDSALEESAGHLENDGPLGVSPYSEQSDFDRMLRAIANNLE